MKAREGDFVKTSDGIIFDVKGLVHPMGKVIAFIRFTPDAKGNRKRKGISYSKVYPLQERYKLLKERFPQYLVHDPVFDEWLCEVPIRKVKKHYKPIGYLLRLRRKRRLNKVETQALQFAELLKRQANVPWNKLGVSGSLLAGLYTPNSDTDLIVYGSQNCRKVHEALRVLVQDKTSQVRAYNLEELKSLFDFRSKDTAMRFEDFVRTESRKVFQGKFSQRDYFVRCVKDWNEVSERYGSVRYNPVGYAKIRARVIDDLESLFTPCSYKIGGVEILEGPRVESVDEIASFRGRFCEQAKSGEAVIAQGKVERVQKIGQREYYRLLLGNKPSDHMILA